MKDVWYDFLALLVVLSLVDIAFCGLSDNARLQMTVMSESPPSYSFSRPGHVHG